MITLALGMVIWGLAFRWVSLTKGDNGIAGVPRPSLGPLELNGPLPFFYFCLVATAVAWALMGLLVVSQFTSRSVRYQLLAHLRGWWMEITAMILSLVSFIAIIVTLTPHDETASGGSRPPTDKELRPALRRRASREFQSETQVEDGPLCKRSSS